MTSAVKKATAAPKMPVILSTKITDKNAPGLMLGISACPKCKGSGHDECNTCDGTGETSCGNHCCDGSHKCGDCGGSGGGPCACFADPCSGRVIIAAEATRLWWRDIGRSITTGTADVYIAFAVRAAKDGELPGVMVDDE